MFVQVYIVFLSSLAHLSLSANTCYFPNGEPSSDVPCDADALFTQCCGSRSACLTNGLCILEASNDTGINYARGTCTDQTWGSSLCPQQCQLNQDTPNNSSAYDFRTNGVQVWQCGSQGYAEEAKYCCESEAERQRCCSTEKAVFTLAGAEVGASTSASPTSASTTPTPSFASSAKTSFGLTPTSFTASQTASPSTSGGSPTPTTTGDGADSSKAIGIGAGVGGGVGFVLLIAVIYFLVRRHRHRGGRTGLKGPERQGPEVSELPGTPRKQIVEVWTQPQELPSRAPQSGNFRQTQRHHDWFEKIDF